MRQNMNQKSLFSAATMAACLLFANFSQAQQASPDGCTQWKTYTDTVWVEQDVTENRVINETSYETKEVTKSRPRWVSEERERTITEEKPVEQTSERVVTRTVRKPVTTTKTRIKTRVEKSYEDVTEMREETYTVRKPITETVMEEQEVRVRRPVTKRSIKKEEVTVYRPQESTQTTMVPGTLLVPGPQTTSRPRPRWLSPGYYTDPYSGQSVWRRRGLHWVDEPQYGQTAVPVAIPQQSTTTTLVPETIVKEKPIEVTTYVDEYETRKVPVEVERMVEETRTRKVPVTVRVPKSKTIEEEIPYTETTYVDETITETVPYTETVMKKVTRKEPYTVMKESWQDYTETVRVPKTVSKTVPYVAKYRVPYYVEVRVPCDAAGRPVARGQQVAGTHRLHPAWRKMMTKVADSTESAKETAETSVFETPDSGAAQFDVPDATEESNSAKSVLPAAPTGLKFSDKAKSVIKTETSAPAMKRIVPPKAKIVPEDPRETEESKELSRQIEERFRNLGIVSDDEAESASKSVETQETSATAEDRVLEADPPEPAKVDFDPEPLAIEVEVPPEAVAPNEKQKTKAAQPDVETTDDDTIEQDVELTYPDRS